MMRADSPRSQGQRLLNDSSTMKTVAVNIYCHLSVALLCLNVMFDLLFLGIPVFLLHKMRILPNRLYLSITSVIINWTTPIVFVMPLVFSGSRVFCNDIALLEETKRQNSLLLSNHGSRIDWMIGMFVGFSRRLTTRASERIRVGFVAEALIQFMPLVGWYRKLVCHDIFVWRSFLRDAPTIEANINDFHDANENRMLFLSPEGVVVDFSQKDMEYIAQCRKFCIDQKYKPFDYVLTPRYKGSMTLLQQVQDCNGPVVSVCTAFIRDGKLLNCNLLSPDRVVPDIYTLNQGIAGSPVDIYIHLKAMNITKDMKDPKQVMLENYKEKDAILAEWDKQTSAGTAADKSWMSQFEQIETHRLEGILYQIAHAAVMTTFALWCGRLDVLFNAFGVLFGLVSGCHTIGWLINSTSMESVPFETGIKAFAMWLENLTEADKIRQSSGKAA